MPACMVHGCYNSTGRSQGVSFHRFPPDGPLFEQWLQALKHPDLLKDFRPQKHHVVCSQHFQPWDFKDDLHRRLMGTYGGGNWCRRRLKPEAVPSKFLFAKPIATAQAEDPARNKVRASHRSSVTFSDVAAYFSEEEWIDLADWEKELYRNVMREIHGVLKSLGYTIVNPSVLLRIKPEDVMNFREPLDIKDTGMGSLEQGYQTVHPPILLRIRKVEEVEKHLPIDYQNMEEQESLAEPFLGYEIANQHVLRTEEEPGTVVSRIYTAPPVNQASVAPTIKEEMLYMGVHGSSQGKGSYEDPDTGQVIDVGVHKQAMEVCGSSLGRGSQKEPSSGQVIVNPNIKQEMEEEKQLYIGVCGSYAGRGSLEGPSTDQTIVNPNIKQETDKEEKLFMGVFGSAPGRGSQEDPCAVSGTADAETLCMFLVNEAQETYFWNEEDFRRGDDGHHSCTAGRRVKAGASEDWASRSRRKSAHLILKHPSLSGSTELLPE